MAQQMIRYMEEQMEVDEERCLPIMEKNGIKYLGEKKMDFKIERLTRSEIESLFEDHESDSETESESESDAVPGSDSDNADSDAESMTLKELNAYIEECMEEYFEKDGVNISRELKEEAEEVEDDLRFLHFEYLKKKKASEILHRNQVKFLRHIGMLPKPETASAEVSVDFPIDLEAFRYYAEKYKFSKGQKLIVDLSDEKILTSSIKYATNTASKSPPVKITQEPDSEPSYTVSSATEINPQSVLDPNVKVKVECIDLTDETPSKTDEAPVTIVKTPVKIVKKPVKIVKKPAKIVETPMQPKPSCSRLIARAVRKLKHPSPLPLKPFCFLYKHLPSSPPKPSLSVCVAATGIILKWEMPLYAPPNAYAKLDSYELFWYEELENMQADSQLWKSIGSVQALALPMACTLTMFKDNTRHHFAVRAMDIYKRYGEYSNPVSALYKEEK